MHTKRFSANFPKRAGIGLVLLGVWFFTPAPMVTLAATEVKLPTLTEIALANNPGIAAAKRQSKAEKLKVIPAAVPPDPELMIESMDNPLGSVMESVTPKFGFTWSQMIPFPGKLNAAFGRQQAEADTAYQSYVMKAAEVQKEVALMYYGIAALDRELDIAARKQKQLEALGAVIAAGYSAGKATLSEFIRTNTMKAMVQTEILGMEAERARMAAQLVTLLGQPLPKDTVFTYQLKPLKQIPPETDFTAAALANFPEIRMKQAMEQGMKAEARQMQLEALPDFTLLGKLESMENGDRAYSLGISIPLPIFFFIKQGPSATAAETTSLAASDERREVANRISQEVHARYLALRNANEALSLYETAIKSGAQQAFDVALKDYQIKRVGFNELIETFQGLYDSLSGLEKTKNMLMEAQVYLNFYTANTLRWEGNQ